MNPVTVTCNGSCTVSHVVTIDFPVFQLDTADASLIAGAILAVWAVGWAFKMLIRTLNLSDGNSSTQESD